MSDLQDASPLGGRPPLRPWQWVVILGTCLAVMLVLPAGFRAAREWMHPKPADTNTAPARAVGSGKPFVPPKWDDQQPAGVEPAAARALTIPPQSQQPLVQQLLQHQAKSPEEEARESDLSWGQNGSASRAAEAHAGTQEPHQTATEASALGDALKPTVLDGVRATRMRHPEFTVPEGTPIPCIMDSALDTSAPGLVIGHIPHEVRGMKLPGQSVGVVLIDKGSQLFGEVQHGVVNGLDRVFVLWHKIRTPDGVKIAVDSPATDEAGANGVGGNLDQHLGRKLRATLFITAIDGGIQLGTAALQAAHGSGNGNNTFFFGGGGGFSSPAQNAATEMLRHDQQIPDVLVRPQGGGCMLITARDLSFENVYAVRRR